MIDNQQIVAEFTGLSKKFGSTFVLNDINLNIQQGEILAIVGHNGSGKSTLLKLATGILRPDSGVIKVRGKTTEFHSILEARKLGFELLSQEPALFPHLSVLENIFVGAEPTHKLMGLHLLRRKEMYRRAEGLHRQTGIEQLPLDSLVSKLSHGQQALVGFMRILNSNPTLLALDEPVAALGYREREGVNRLIMEMAIKGVSILLVTHILKDVIELATRVAVLQRGQITYYGQTKNLTELELVEHLVK